MGCTRCGSEVPADARFCPSCGAPVGSSLQEERKLVSILFVDMVGSTARADGADPEDVRDLNQLYYKETRERVERHGGVLEKYIGDAVVAVFGAPLARSDDAERAVRAALSVLDGILELNERHLGLDLEVRAAVCTGEAVVAVDSTPADALVTGDVVNTAARLQNAAPPGCVLVDSETHGLTRRAFDYEEFPPIEAKGKREPILVWLVGKPLAAAGGQAASDTPFVGRDHELLLMSTLWDRAVSAGAPHLISVLGPAGIGKSRLVREFAFKAEKAGGRLLWGRSLPYEEQTPYLAFGEMLRNTAGIFENDPAEMGRAKLATLVDSLFPASEAIDTTRYLSLLLGLGLDEPASEAIHLLFAARRSVELLSEQDPLLILFEDVHWADGALLDLVDYLVSHVSAHPVVFVSTARPEFLEKRSSWGGGMTSQTTLLLDPLTTDEATSVVASLLTGANPSTVAKVVETAEGNPLFLEELVASLGDAIDAEELPATVRAAIAARIDTLPPQAREALLKASVIGQTFWRRVLEGIGELDDVDAALEALESRGLVLRRSHSQVEDDVEFAFKHALIRDVAYATLPRARRREMHAATARLIEASAPDRAELAWILAHHWREGGEPSRAVDYLIAAGDRARAALAVEETYDFYTQALELAGTDAERLRIRLRRALALVELEEFTRADPELEALIPDLQGLDEVEAIFARGRSTFWTEQTEQTLALAQLAFDLARERGAAELEPPALGLLGATYAMRGEAGDLDKAIELEDRALEMWIPGTRLLELAEAYHMHTDNLYWTGDYPRALELSSSAAEVGGLEPHSAEYVLRGGGMNGLILSGMGRYEEALASAEAAIATARRMGRRDNVVINYSTMVLRDIFWLDEAHDRSALVVERLGPSDFNMPWMNARADLIGADLLLGRLGEVERALPSAWDDAVASHAWERWLVSGRLASVRAETEFQLGHNDDAITWARRALELARPVRRQKYETIALVTLGRSLAAEGLVEDAVRELGVAVAIADALGTPLLRWQTRAAMGSAELLSSDTGARGEARLIEAAHIIREIADGLAAERAARYLAAPQVVEVLSAAI